MLGNLRRCQAMKEAKPSDSRRHFAADRKAKTVAELWDWGIGREKAKRRNLWLTMQQLLKRYLSERRKRQYSLTFAPCIIRAAHNLCQTRCLASTA